MEAKEKVVTDTLHHLTPEAVEARWKKMYEAKVWVKPWLDFKELQPAGVSPHHDATSFTTAELDTKKESRLHGSHYAASKINKAKYMLMGKGNLGPFFSL